MQLLLLCAYVVTPVAILTITLPAIAIVTGEVTGSLTGFLLVYSLALCIAVFASVAASVLFMVIAGITAVVQWRGSELLMFDFTSGICAGVLFGCCSASIIVASVNHGDVRSKQSVLRQLGAIILGLTVSFPLVIAVIYTIFSVTAGRQSGALHGGWLIWTMVLPPLVISVLTVYLRTRSLQLTVLPGLFCLFLFSSGFGDLGYEYDVSVGGFTLLMAIMTVAISTFSMLSFFSYALVLPFVGNLPASISSAAGGLVIHLGLKLTFTYYPFIENLVLSLTLIFIAILFRYFWSIVAYPFQAAWNRVIVELDTRRTGAYQLLSRHSFNWDEIQILPFYELEDYLVSSTEINSDRGTSYIEQVNRSNQQWAAQAALTEVDARRLENLPDINSLTTIRSNENAGLLPTSAGLILRSFSQVAQDVSAALSQPSRFNQVLVLRTVTKDLEQLQLELNRNYKDKIARRFVQVAEHWRQLVVDHTDALDQESKASNEIPNPYTVGAPLTRKQKIFVGRTDIARFLENILKQQDHPPLLLYGPRRMGKTSLLYQLHWMLPRHILTLIVDLQGPVGLAQDHSGFVYALIRSMCRAAARANIELTSLPREDLNEDPFIKFDDWLNTIESEMLTQGCDTMLLALDEFEALDIALREGTLRDHAVLGMLRHVAQHRSNIKIMLVGSHTLGDFKRWASYFVNAQVIELGYLSSSEAKQLIEQPIAGYPLDYHPDASLRIFEFTRGHPYLVQLTCAELIALKNSQPESQRQIATVHDIELCIPHILQRGQQFFTDIELNQIDDAGRELVAFLAASGYSGATKSAIATAFPALQHSDTLQTLEQRNIIEQVEGQYQFQVEAVRLWFDDSVNRHTA